MEFKELKDGNGDLLPVYTYEDRYLPPNFKGDPEKKLKEFRNLEVRDDDIFIASYPKTGKHWTYEITNMLISGKTEYMEKYSTTGSSSVSNNFDNMPSPRIITSHYRFKDFPKQIPEKKPKLIYINRNVKDCSVSFYHHVVKMAASSYKGTFDGFIPLFLKGEVPYGSWFEHTKEWEGIMREHSDWNILHLVYEDMKRDLYSSIVKIAKFLGVRENKKLFKEIAKKCDFGAMKNSDKFGSPWKAMTIDGKSHICRKGEVGDWKNYYTVKQNEMFDQHYAVEMQDSNLSFAFES